MRSPVLLPSLLLAMLSALSTSHAQTRGAWEKFSNVENTRHWSVNWFATGQFFDPLFNEDPFEPGADTNFIYTVFSEQGGGLTISNFRGPTRPLTYLSGSLATKRIIGYSFDLIIENPAAIGSLDTSFYSVTTGRYYFSPPIPVTLGINTITRKFFEGTWKVFVPGTGYVDTVIPPNALNNVNDFVIRAFPANVEDTSGIIGVDNFKTIPETIVPMIATSVSGDQFVMNFDRWIAQTYTLKRAVPGMGLAQFETVAGAAGVTGEGAFAFSATMSGPKDFFRVETDVQNVVIGNLGNPAGWVPPAP